MIWTILTRNPVARFIAWAVAGLVAVAGVWVAGRRSGATRAENKTLQGYVETRKATDEVDMGNDAGLVRDGLHKRDPNKR